MAIVSFPEYLKSKAEHFEALCKRCGECCGALDDPCTKLVGAGDGTFSCADYYDRLGPRETVSGKIFTCVDIRKHIADGTLRPGCGYWKAAA